MATFIRPTFISNQFLIMFEISVLSPKQIKYCARSARSTEANTTDGRYNSAVSFSRLEIESNRFTDRSENLE